MNGDNYNPAIFSPDQNEDEETQSSQQGRPASRGARQFVPLPDLNASGAAPALPNNLADGVNAPLPESISPIPSETQQQAVPLDPLRSKMNMLDLTLKAGPQYAKQGVAEKLAGIILAGTEGWTRMNPGAGYEAATKLWDRPRQQAEQDWTRKVSGLEHEVGSEEKLRENQNKERQEADNAGFRRRQEKHMDWTESGGPEEAKMSAENRYRQSQAPSLKKSGYSDQEVAEYLATGKTRDNMPRTDMEAITMAHEIGPDGKPTARAVQAAAAHKQYVEDRIKEIRASKDPNDTVKLVSVYMSDLTNQRAQIAREAEQLQNDKLTMVDQTKQARLQALQKTMKDLDSDIESARGFIGKRVPGLGGSTPAKPAGGSSAPSGSHWDAQAGRYVSDQAPTR